MGIDNDTVDQFLSSMAETLKNAKDFALEQLPIVAQEILKFNLAMAITWMVVGLIMIVISFIFQIRVVVPTVKEDIDYVPMYIIPSLGYLAGGLLILLNVMSALKITLAPRVYLLEYMAQLLTHHK